MIVRCVPTTKSASLVVEIPIAKDSHWLRSLGYLYPLVGFWGGECGEAREAICSRSICTRDLNSIILNMTARACAVSKLLAVVRIDICCSMTKLEIQTNSYSFGHVFPCRITLSISLPRRRLCCRKPTPTEQERVFKPGALQLLPASLLNYPSRSPALHSRREVENTTPRARVKHLTTLKVETSSPR